ncbi:MAG TPA: hypothetical protein VGO59_16150 [Verrucomicrobiae bacterium]
MKTPREVLFQRHRAVEAKLDAISRAAARPSPRAVNFLRDFWLEVFWTPRRIWAGLAAVWLVILAANLDFHAGAPRMTAAVSPNAGGFLIALHEPEQVMAEFTRGPAPQKAEPPKPPAALPPRSARHVEFRII